MQFSVRTGAGQGTHLDLRQPLGGKGDHSRSISASGVISTSERRFIISSVIGGFLGDRLSSQPDPSPVTTARPLPRYGAIERALTRSLAPDTPPSGARPCARGCPRGRGRRLAEDWVRGKCPAKLPMTQPMAASRNLVRHQRVHFDG
jgi:hypothetical protein